MVLMQTDFQVTAEIEQQKAIDDLVRETRMEFPEAKISVAQANKKLVPGELVLLIGIEVSAAVLIKILDKMWSFLSGKAIKVKAATLEQVRETAETFLLSKHFYDFRLTKTEDRGLYFALVYVRRNITHRLYISKYDLKILEYKERKSS